MLKLAARWLAVGAGACLAAEAPAARAAEQEPSHPPGQVGPDWSGDDAGASQDEHLRYQLEGVEVVGNLRTADRVVLRFVPFGRGDQLDVADPELELTRFRLLGTGFFSAVRLSLRKGARRGRAVLVVDVVERNTLIIENVSMGIAADEDADGNSEPISPYFGLQVAETNLAGTGIILGAGFAAAADQFSFLARFADPALSGTDWMVTASLRYTDALDFFGNRQVSFESPGLQQREVTDYAVVDYTRFGGRVGIGHDLSLSTRLLVDYRLERVSAVVPTVASHLRGHGREPIDFDILPGASVLSSLETALIYDSRDAPFLPTRGTLATVRAGLGMPPAGSNYGYAKVELGYRRWWRLPWRHVLSFGGQLGAITGDAPFFEKFYVGDFSDLLPDRLLGLNPDRRQPPNLLGTNIVEVRYGDYAARLDTEYRVSLYQGKGSVYGADFFAGAGLYGVAGQRDLSDPASGYDGLARVPVDLTYNAGLRVETYVGGFSLAFSNLLGLLPGRGGQRK